MAECLDCLTTWRGMFTRRDAITTTFLIDILGVEYLRNGIALLTAGETRRVVLVLDDPLHCGLYISRAISDIMTLEQGVDLGLI